MALSDYELLAARSFEEPGNHELRAEILVCGDALSQQGDPRGPLITMEHALHDADGRRAVELRKAIHEHAATEGSSLLGSAASLMHAHRTLSLDWRSGKIYGMSIDARYLPRKSKISAGELVRQAIQSPAANDLRRLRVRVRSEEDTRSIVNMLAPRVKRQLPLEELDIYTNAWPARMTPTTQTVLQETYPRLYYVVHENRTISLPPMGVLHRDVERYIPDVESCDPPTTPEARAFLGRCLTHANRELRVAALERIVQLRSKAKVYERVLCTLLQPGIAGPSIVGTVTSEPHLPIVQALVAIGPSRATRRMLDKVASRPQYYDAETRSAAGKATELDRR